MSKRGHLSGQFPSRLFPSLCRSLSAVWFLVSSTGFCLLGGGGGGGGPVFESHTLNIHRTRLMTPSSPSKRFHAPRVELGSGYSVSVTLVRGPTGVRGHCGLNLDDGRSVLRVCVHRDDGTTLCFRQNPGVPRGRRGLCRRQFRVITRTLCKSSRDRKSFNLCVTLDQGEFPSPWSAGLR